MSILSRRQSRKLTHAHALKVMVVTGLAVFLTAGASQIAHAETAPSSPDGPIPSLDAHPASDVLPVFKLVEGAKGSPDPYTPRELDIPAGRQVALEITDNIGGCALVTVFPGLGVDGSTVRAQVPVGQTRRVVILAAKPGRYRYHCSENMFFGEIVAR